MNNIISVIIPVYNDSKAIKETLIKIIEYSKLQISLEIIVVDNGSTDNTVEIVKEFDSVKLLNETQYLNSPYSARNRGIEICKGDIIVLLDSTCCPSKNWLSKGVEALNKNKADIVAGNVKFDFKGKLTAGKIYDSLTNIKMKESVLDRQVAKTANLFIKKEVFHKIGKFPEGIRSGADVRWTKKATQNGFKIVYSEEAYVYKIARSLKGLLKKQKRVALYQPIIWYEEDGKIKLSRYFNPKKLLPLRPKTIKEFIKKRGSSYMERYTFRLVCIGFIIKNIMFIYNIIGLINFIIKDEQKEEVTPLN